MVTSRSGGLVVCSIPATVSNGDSTHNLQMPRGVLGGT